LKLRKRIHFSCTRRIKNGEKNKNDAGDAEA